MYIKEHILP